MEQGRYLKLVLTVIAVALSVIAISQIEVPPAKAGAAASLQGDGWEMISQKVLTSDSSTIVFDNISSHYRFLWLVGTVQIASPSSRVAVRLNGDAGSNYSRQITQFYGSSMATQQYSDITSFDLEGPLGQMSAPNEGSRLIQVMIGNVDGDIKFLEGRVSVEIGSGGVTQVAHETTAGRWEGTAAVSEITLIDAANSSPGFRTGSRVMLFGAPPTSMRFYRADGEGEHF